MDDEDYYAHLQGLVEAATTAGVFDRMEPAEVEVAIHPSSPARNVATGDVLNGMKLMDKVHHKIHGYYARVVQLTSTAVWHGVRSLCDSGPTCVSYVGTTAVGIVRTYIVLFSGLHNTQEIFLYYVLYVLFIVLCIIRIMYYATLALDVQGGVLQHDRCIS